MTHLKNESFSKALSPLTILVVYVLAVKTKDKKPEPSRIPALLLNIKHVFSPKRMEKDAPYRAILSIISAAVAMHTNITVAVTVKVVILIITLLSFFLN